MGKRSKAVDTAGRTVDKDQKQQRTNKQEN